MANIASFYQLSQYLYPVVGFIFFADILINQMKSIFLIKHKKRTYKRYGKEC